MRYKSLRDYLDLNCIKYDANKCWEWKRSHSYAGYGKAWWDGKKHYAHRLVYKHYFGEFEDNLLVCHKCDNPSCVNPQHLFLGTHLDNNRDRQSKGRQANTQGESNPFAKLREIEVIDILTRLKRREKGRHIAGIYNVSEYTISKIKHGVNWAHLQGVKLCL